MGSEASDRTYGLNHKPVHFSSLIPKMLMFTLAISCLTMSNLPWFRDLTFQIPMGYCSSQHQTLLSPQDTSIIEHFFHSVSVSSFFLKIFLCNSPAAYWTPTTWGAHLVVSYLFPFSYCSRVKARIFKCFAIPFFSGPHLSEASMTHVLGGPAELSP